MHEVLVNRLGGLSLPRKSVVRLTDRTDMTLDVYHRRKTTTQQQKSLSREVNRKSQKLSVIEKGQIIGKCTCICLHRVCLKLTE